MRIRLYSVKDRLLGVYLAPFAARADVEAVRQMKATLKDPQMQGSSLMQSPKDFDLCYISTMDDETGEVFGEIHAAGPAPAVVVNIGKLLAAEARNAEDVEAKTADQGV